MTVASAAGPSRGFSRPLTAAVGVVVVAACASTERSGGGAWRGTIDTLASGTIVVHNPQTGIWDSASAWRIEEELRIGSAEGEGPPAFNQIADLQVDSLGRIYVLESQAQEIRVFDSTGRFVRTVGRKGRGPGEFTQAIGIRWDPAGRIWVVDQGTARYTILDTAGRVLATRTRPLSGWFTWRWQGGLDSTGRVYEWYRQPGAMERDALLRYDTTFKAADTFPLPAYQGELFKIEEKNRRVWGSVPYTPTLSWVFDPRGYIWFGITVPYRIYQRRLAGDTVRVIERAYQPLPVTSEDRDSAIARLDWFTKQGGKVDASRIPRVKPAFDLFFLDDRGYLWVDPVTPKQDQGRVFDVFDPDGRYLGQARANVRLSGQPVFRGDCVYATTEDESGIPYVIRARIIRGST